MTGPESGLLILAVYLVGFFSMLFLLKGRPPN